MVIRGVVQGVGFRYFILRRATELGLSGDVRNLPDGAVEVRACGDAAGVAQLLELARRGPSSARVDDVEVQSGYGARWPTGFRIRP